MARLARLEIPNGCYHVINRGHQRRVIFRNRPCYEDFLKRLGAFPERFGVRIHTYVLRASTEARRQDSARSSSTRRWNCRCLARQYRNRQGLESAYIGVTLDNVASRDFTIAHAEDLCSAFIGRMWHRGAMMAVVVRGNGVPLASNVLGVITKEHVADSIAYEDLSKSTGGTY
jgi:hypothetical protein